MELVYAALLLHSAGRDVTEDSVQDVLDGADVEYESAEVKALVAALEDVDIEEAMETPVATGAPAAAADGGAQEPADQEESADEEEAEDEPAPEDEGASEEEAAEGLGSLF